MIALRLGFVLSVALALPLLCSADYTITFLDSTDTLKYSVNFGGSTTINTCPPSATPELCAVLGLTFPPGTVAPGTQLLFNIYEPDGVTLSDTLDVTTSIDAGGTPYGNINAVFQSDVDGVPLAPLVGGTSIVEDGTVQTAATIPFTGGLAGQNFIVQFQSDIDAVPEPRWGVLVTLLVLGIALVAKRRRLS
jgi:hypothetical protein